MFAPRFELAGYESLSKGDRIDVMRMAVKLLVHSDRAFLRAHPHTPQLYASGVRYQKESPDSENYQDIPRTLELRTGDCEDLVAWRLAELQEAGEDAHLVLREYRDGADTDFHVLLARANGEIEDPSRLLGM